LFDEPFGALDTQTRVHLRREIRALLRKVNVPAIFIIPGSKWENTTEEQHKALFAKWDHYHQAADEWKRQVAKIAGCQSEPEDGNGNGNTAEQRRRSAIPSIVARASDNPLLQRD